jgi:hypothetical protein
VCLGYFTFFGCCGALRLRQPHVSALVTVLLYCPLSLACLEYLLCFVVVSLVGGFINEVAAVNALGGGVVDGAVTHAC